MASYNYCEFIKYHTHSTRFMECLVKGCRSIRPGRAKTLPNHLKKYYNPSRKFFRIPRELQRNCGMEVTQLSKERRLAWIKILTKNQQLTEHELKWRFVCSRHFKLGKPALLKYKHVADWAPNLHMNHETCCYGSNQKCHNGNIDTEVDTNVGTETITNNTDQLQKSNKNKTRKEYLRCRTCLDITEDTKSLDLNSDMESIKNLKNMLKSFVEVLDLSVALKPLVICYKCEKILKLCHSFKTQCERIDESLIALNEQQEKLNNKRKLQAEATSASKRLRTTRSSPKDTTTFQTQIDEKGDGHPEEMNLILDDIEKDIKAEIDIDNDIIDLLRTELDRAEDSDVKDFLRSKFRKSDDAKIIPYTVIPQQIISVKNDDESTNIGLEAAVLNIKSDNDDPNSDDDIMDKFEPKWFKIQDYSTCKSTSPKDDRAETPISANIETDIDGTDKLKQNGTNNETSRKSMQVRKSKKKFPIVYTGEDDSYQPKPRERKLYQAKPQRRAENPIKNGTESSDADDKEVDQADEQSAEETAEEASESLDGDDSKEVDETKQHNAEDESEEVRDPLFVNVKEEISPKKYRCNKCGDYFRTKAGLKSHRKIHTKKRKVHITIDKDKHNILCPVCGKKLRKEHAKRHMQRHTLENMPVICSICSKVFKSALALNGHKRVHNTEKSPAVHNVDLKIKDVTKEYKCFMCPFKTNSAELLKNHYMSDHSVVKKEKSEEFVCEICALRCVSRDLLQQHVETHFLLDEDVEISCKDEDLFEDASEMDYEFSQEDNSFKCNKCTEAFETISDLLNHEEQLHS